MNIKKRIAVGIIAFAAVAAFAAPEVTDVVAKQRYPWNGKVDIYCKVTGVNETTDELKFAVAAVMPDSSRVSTVSNFWVMQNGAKLSSSAVHTNGNYQLLWDARADLGQVKYDNMVVRVTCVEAPHGKVQLWEGGPYWATTNIGADEPWEYGYYFCWGDTVGYKRENDELVAADGSSSKFPSEPFGNIPICENSYAFLKREGWITANGVLAPAHDAAHVQWGGKWRMPEGWELVTLTNKCTWTWTTKNGVNGYEVRGKGDYTSASIFLPAAGWGSGTSLFRAGSDGCYWSSVPYDEYSYYGISAWNLDLTYSSSSCTAIYGISGGWRSVRPVQGFTD